VEILHFPSKPLPAPCSGCGGLLCAECARRGMTAVHFSTDGICAYGHRLEATREQVAAKLAAWIDEQGIKAADSAEDLAGRVITSLGAWRVEEWLTAGGTDYLRATAVRYANPDPLTDAQFAVEDYRHGHGGKPPKGRRRPNGQVDDH
jgi:hypothetical protein